MAEQKEYQKLLIIVIQEIAVFLVVKINYYDQYHTIGINFTNQKKTRLLRTVCTLATTNKIQWSLGICCNQFYCIGVGFGV